MADEKRPRDRKTIEKEATERVGASVKQNLGLVSSMLEKGASRRYTADAWVRDMSQLYVSGIRDAARMGSLWVEWTASLSELDLADPDSDGPE